MTNWIWVCTQVRGPALPYKVERGWGRHRLSSSGLYRCIYTHTYEHTYTWSIPYTCVYKSKPLKTKQNNCGRSCSALWRGLWDKHRHSFRRDKGHLELEEALWWQTQRMWDEMWSLALRRERGGLRAKECGLTLEAEKGKKQILPRAPGRKEAGSAVSLIPAPWGALFSDSWHSQL